ERAEMNLAGVPLAQTAPTRLRLAGSRFEIAEWNWAGAGNRLDFTGGVALGGEGAELDVGVAGALDMRMLGAFLPEVATSGRLTIDATATGPAAQPLVNGEVTFDDVDVIVRDPRIVVD